MRTVARATTAEVAGVDSEGETGFELTGDGRELRQPDAASRKAMNAVAQMTALRSHRTGSNGFARI